MRRIAIGRPRAAFVVRGLGGLGAVLPTPLPTWDSLALQYRDVLQGRTGAQLAAQFPGHSVEAVEMILLYNGIPGGIFFTTDDVLAFGMNVGPQVGPNAGIRRLEMMRQAGVPIDYLTARWDRARLVAGDASIPDYASARAATYGTASSPPPWTPPPAPAASYIDGTTGSRKVGAPPASWTNAPAAMPAHLAPGGSHFNADVFYPTDWFTRGLLPPVVTPPPVRSPPVTTPPVTTPPPITGTPKPPKPAPGTLGGIPASTWAIGAGAVALLFLLSND